MNYLLKIIKGIVIGIANAIPGVSGGTMMVSLGIYDDIISSVNNFLKEPKKSLTTLFPYIIGILGGIVGLTYVITYVFLNFPFQTAMIFIGLIVGGVPVLFGKVKGKSLSITNIIVFVIFFLSIILMQIYGGSGSDVNVDFSFINCVILFVIGMIASATMIIPGVSGSMILMILGFYNPIIARVRDFVEALVKWDIDAILKTIGTLVPFGLGVVVGIFAVSKVIELLLNKHETITYSAIIGLVMASPVVILLQMNSPTWGAITIITGILALVVGGVVTHFLGREE